MNEYVADYTSEVINGVEYYPQIKQSNTIKQRFFIKGLDSSDRENGIFNYFNIPIFQPYSFVDLYYKKLPEIHFHVDCSEETKTETTKSKMQSR